MVSTTTQMLRGQIVVGGGVGLTAFPMVRSSPWEEDGGPGVVLQVESIRTLGDTQGGTTDRGGRCWVLDASVKKLMSCHCVRVGGQLLWADRCIRGSLGRFL